MKLLIVDDETIVRTILSSMIKGWDYEVILAANGEEAWTLLQTIHEPVILLVDWIMSGMDGIELCKKIKQSEKARSAHVIMLTVKSEIEDMVVGFAAGADDFLSKPVDPRELSSRLSVGRRILKYKYELEQRNSILQATTKAMEKIMEELNVANEKLRILSMLDEVTGIPNRRSLEDYLAREWGYALRKGEPLTLIMVDADFFKLYNDTYGHQAGDECLRKVASVLNNNITRSGDLVARYGGEEFIVALRNTDTLDGQKVGEYLRQRVEGLGIPHSASEIAPYVTISLGVATMVPETNHCQSALIEKADQALYQAKNSGRNRWVAM